MSLINNIYVGWKYYIFRDEKVEPIALHRASICTGMDVEASRCKYYKTFAGGICTKCICFIKAKVRCTDCHCPLKYW